MSDVKTIFRVIKNRNFTQIHNSLLHDTRLSLKTKGLLCVMLSLPDTWDFHRDHIQSLSSDGKDSLNTAIQEARKFGYITIGHIRDERGRIQNWVMAVYETPGSLDTQEVCPEPGFPHLDNPDLVKPPYSNTNKKTNTKTTATSAAVVDNFKELNERAAKAGIQTVGGVMQALVQTHGAEKVEAKLTLLESKTKVYNPGGWLQSALNSNYEKPKGHCSRGAEVTQAMPRAIVTTEETKELLATQDAWTRSNTEVALAAIADLKRACAGAYAN